MEYTASRQRRLGSRTFEFPLVQYWIFGDDSDGQICRAIDASLSLLTLRERLSDLMHGRTARRYRDLLADGAICVWSLPKSGVPVDRRAQIYNDVLEAAIDVVCPRPPQVKERDYSSFYRFAYASTKNRKFSDALRARYKEKLVLAGKDTIDECLSNDVLVELHAELCSDKLISDHRELLRQEYHANIVEYGRRIAETYQEDKVVEQAKQSLVQSEQKIIDHLMEKSDIELQAQRIAGLIGRSRSFRKPFSD